MARRSSVLMAALVALLHLIAACRQAAPARPASEWRSLARNANGYTDISVEQLAGMLEEKDFTLVNVHIPYEGELPETDLFIPFDEIAGHVEQLPDRDAPIVLYCRSGPMSREAAEALVSLGYTQILQVDGGMGAWEAAAQELLRR